MVFIKDQRLYSLELDIVYLFFNSEGTELQFKFLLKMQIMLLWVVGKTEPAFVNVF